MLVDSLSPTSNAIVSSHQRHLVMIKNLQQLSQFLQRCRWSASASHKTLVFRQFILLGIFNVHIESKSPEELRRSSNPSHQAT